MVRPLDLQDNLSKVQAVERVFQNLRQQPDQEQRAFVLTLKQIALEEKETTEPMDEQHQLELEAEKEKEKERREQKERERKKKKEEEHTRGPSGDHIIDIIA